MKDGVVCNQCVHDGICKFYEVSTEFEKAVDDLIEKYGREVFYADLKCRHKQTNPIVTGKVRGSLTAPYTIEVTNGAEQR